MNIDLHIHTQASDGEFSPIEIVNKALNSNLSTIAITDHDTTEGLKEAIQYAQNKEIDIIPGIEINANVDKGKMHILGLYIDYENPKIQSFQKRLRENRNERNKYFIKMFQNEGINITIEDVKKNASGDVIAKPHFAKTLYEKGYIKDIEEAYTNYFNREPFNIKRNKTPSPKEVINMIKEAKGIAVLAHPQSLKLEDEELRNEIKELKSYGLDGIECFHSNHSLEEMKVFKKIAIENNLIMTKGSDYHGPNNNPEIKMGSGKNDNISKQNDSMLYKNLMEFINNKD